MINKCPVCDSLDVVMGEYVDIGVGMQKCSPDYCMNCWWSEKPFDLTGVDAMSLADQRKLWELQATPAYYQEPPSFGTKGVVYLPEPTDCDGKRAIQAMMGDSYLRNIDICPTVAVDNADVGHQVFVKTVMGE